MRRVGAVNALVGSRRELVANCVHTADATQLDSCVASASIGSVYWALRTKKGKGCHILLQGRRWGAHLPSLGREPVGG